MPALNLKEVIQYVEQNIGSFHEQRIRSLDKLKLKQVLKGKNPYLFKAKNMMEASDIVTGIVDARISSNEETIFGDWLEGLAIFINQKVYAGWKSSTQGIDLEFDKDGRRHIVSIKSGPKWSNAKSLQKMRENFKTAIRTLRTSNSKLNVIAVNGCCYGKDNKPDKGDYYKYCGQQFWKFISGNDELYLDIIEPLGHKAKVKNEEFMRLYANVKNKFTKQFTNEFCNSDGSIDWNKIVKLNSAAKV